MGIYIKGMKMPERCWDCYFCYDCVYCLAVDVQFSDKEDFEPSERRLSDCPLVPVPSHGRLIDADELHSALRKRAKEFSNSEYGEGVKCGLADAREYIKIAPTIIPAEEGEIS